jgi:hypothetical protein
MAMSLSLVSTRPAPMTRTPFWNLVARNIPPPKNLLSNDASSR